MSEVGIKPGIQRPTAPAVAQAQTAATTGTPIPPSLTRVQLPARVADPVRPKRPAEPLTSPRDLEGGKSPLAGSPLGDAHAAVDALSEREAGTSGGSAQGASSGTAEAAKFQQAEFAADHDFASGRYTQYSSAAAMLEELGA